jgi:hypothetical protein
MGSMAGLYIKVTDKLRIETIRERFPSATLESPSEFALIEVDWEKYALPAPILSLSQQLQTEVIFLAFDSVSDSFTFTHTNSVQVLRHLDGSRDWGWNAVVGTAQAWESLAFFDESVLKTIEDDETFLAEVMQFLTNKTLTKTDPEKGGWHGLVDARESARFAAIEHRLTYWLSDWHASPWSPKPVIPSPEPEKSKEKLGRSKSHVLWVFLRTVGLLLAFAVLVLLIVFFFVTRS